MKRFCTVFMILTVFSCFTSLVSAQVVRIPDPNLDTAVREILRIPSDEDITRKDLAKLESFGVNNRPISDITGIEYMINLEALHMTGSQISDITPIAQLTNLQVLNLSGNQISDLTPLAGLKNLMILNMRFNQISDLTPLTWLENLVELNLMANQISDLTPLAGLKNLRSLELHANQISDISPLATLKNLGKSGKLPISLDPRATSGSLDVGYPSFAPYSEWYLRLIIFGNAVMSISELLELEVGPEDFVDVERLIADHGVDPRSKPIREWIDLGFRYLRPTWVVRDILGLANNQISDLSPLAGLDGLRKLDLRSNQISDLFPLAGLTNLRVLNLAYNQISELTFLNSNLVQLDLSRNQISDITKLLALTNLRILNLRINQISNISPLIGKHALVDLDLSQNQISDITPLGALPLRGLYLRCNQLSNPSRYLALGLMNELEVLDLSHNQIEAPVLPSALKILNLSHNQIQLLSNVPSRVLLPELEWLDMGENPIAAENPLKLLEYLPWFRRDGNPLPYHHVSPSAPEILTDPTAPTEEQGFTYSEFSHLYLELHSYGRYKEPHCPATDPTQNTAPQDTPAETSGETPPQDTSPETSGTAEDGDEGVWPPIFLVDSESNTLHGIMHGILEDETEDLALSVRNVTSLAVDISGGKLYWTEKTSDSTGKIWQANLDGSNVEVVKELMSVPLQITLDAEGGKLYLMNAWGKIQRMNLDGTDFQPNFITDLEAPTGVVVDISGGKLYWIEKTGGTTGKIRRANLEGSTVELVKELTSVPLGIALDAENGKLYLTNAWGKIQRMNLDGTDFQPNLITDLEAPTGIAVSGDNIYWIEGNRIRRASLNGENIHDAVRSLSSISAFALGMLPPADMPSTTDDEETTDTSVPIVFAAADVNEDGKVNKTDLLLVATALGETSPTNPRVDVNGDGTVAIADLLLVVEDLDDPVVAAAPAITELPTSADWKTLEAHLHLLRVSSDGSFRYWYAIAFLEGLLASMRPDETLLLPNYPNPFNPETWIPYQLANASDVQILIYDVRGTIVRRIALGYQSAGYYTSPSRAAYWDGRNALGEQVASGLYFYQLETDTMSSMRKMVILK